jgi:glycosyltransferase involved in cell wall biosynthesis
LKDIFKSVPFTVEPVASLEVPNHTDGHNGTLYISRAEDFASKLNLFYSNYADYAAIASHARLLIQDKYDWTNIRKQLVEYISMI